jgi:hypothetical protein
VRQRREKDLAGANYFFPSNNKAINGKKIYQTPQVRKITPNGVWKLE